jgi:hypothetical protein
MADPLTLTALGAVALTEGIKFLYTQASELLKRRRERKKAAADAAAARAEQAARAAPAAPVEVATPAVVEGELAPVTVDDGALDRLAEEISGLRHDLGRYVDETDPAPVDPSDERLVATVDALRQAIEAVWGQRITFKGERREPSGPVVRGAIDVDSVAGNAAAVRAGRIGGGATVEGTVRAGRVERGGTVTGVEADTIGGD